MIFPHCVFFLVSVKNLLKETKEVVEYELLGIELNVEQAEIDKISKECQSKVELSKSKLFLYWLDNEEEASWEKLIHALKSIGKKCLASKLFEKLRCKGNNHMSCNCPFYFLSCQ